MIICGTNNIDYSKASSIVNGLLCVALKLVSKSVQQVIISGILLREFVNTIRRNKIMEVNELLKIECSKLTSRVFYMEPDPDWVTNENLLNMKYFYRDHLHLIKEGYEKLSKTISISLMYAWPYIQDDAKQSYYSPLKHSAIFEAPNEAPFQEPLLFEGDRKEKITIKRNIFTVKPIKRSIQEVTAESYAVPNVLEVEVVRTPQLCSARLRRQQELKSANYVDTCPPQDKAEIIMNVEPRDVENETSELCGLPVETSRFKRHDFCRNLFLFLHFIAYAVELSKCLVPSFSKLGTLYAFFLITFLASSNFINLNSDHKIIRFTDKRSFTEILDVNKHRLKYKKFQGETAEITHPIFDRRIRCVFHSNINLDLQPLKSNMRNNNFFWINFVMPVVFLYKKFFCPRSNIFIFCYLIQLSVAMYMLGFPYRSTNFNRSLKTCPKNEFFTIKTVRITNKINELFLETSFKLFSVSTMKNKNNYLYLKMLLILSGDINLNPGPANRHQIKNHKFEVFTRKGLHFIHLNINSLLPKIDDLQYITKKSNAAVISISETKSDNTVYDSEVAIDVYNIARSDRNKKGRGAACYIRINICFNLKTCLSNNIENIFIDLLFPKTKPITVGVIYKPPDQTRFLEQTLQNLKY